MMYQPPQLPMQSGIAALPQAMNPADFGAALLNRPMPQGMGSQVVNPPQGFPPQGRSQAEALAAMQAQAAAAAQARIGQGQQGNSGKGQGGPFSTMVDQAAANVRRQQGLRTQQGNSGKGQDNPLMQSLAARYQNQVGLAPAPGPVNPPAQYQR
jgi:hypothetical protein